MALSEGVDIALCECEGAVWINQEEEEEEDAFEVASRESTRQ